MWEGQAYFLGSYASDIKAAKIINHKCKELGCPLKNDPKLYPELEVKISTYSEKVPQIFIVSGKYITGTGMV